MDLGFNLMAEEIPAPTNVLWDEVRDAAELAFNIWLDSRNSRGLSRLGSF